MNRDEAGAFEKHEMFEAILKLRNWDEQAKDTTLNLASRAQELLTEYRRILIQLI